MSEEATALPTFTVKECYAGTIVNEPGCVYGPRLQRELQLVLLHTGTMRVEIDGTAADMLPGHVYLILPGEWVRIVFAGKEGTWHRWITVFSYDIAEDALEALSRLPRTMPLSGQLNQLIDVLVGLQKQDAEGRGSVRNTLALAAFQLYASECRSSRDAEAHPAIPLVKSYIEEHYREELTLAELAEAANVSPGHLIRLFRQHEAMTPMHCLWQYRVSRGVELLRTTGLSVGAIAERSGFKTSYHFARMVKQQEGRTPTEIQRNEKPFPSKGMLKHE